jgi:hypothetical protein
LTSIEIPDGVTSIGVYAFSDCTNLTVIDFNATAMGDLSYNNFVFADAGTSGTGITVNIGANVTKIPACLFYLPYEDYAHKIVTVNFAPNSVCKSIGAYAFVYCSSLTSITIPDSVTGIGDYAFYDCSSLTTVYYGGTNETAWNGITKGSNNTPLTGAALYYYSETEPATVGNYWHYINGIPTKWN